MSNHLVIVESPAKAKTLKKYLGNSFQVLASFGHLRDLIPNKGAVDPEHKFTMNYEIIAKNAKHVTAIAKALKTADDLYLATDPDREGEAISWHIHEIMQQKKLLKNKPVHRIVFHEITKSALQEAIQNPRAISMELVNAQQARRALDFLVGFNLSPLLWKKIRRGLSAGRVQSPALRLIVEREEAITKFTPQEYWTINANVQHEKQQFPAKLIEYQKQKLEQFSITTDQQAQEVVTKLLAESNGKLTVAKVTKKQRKRNPSPPFITSTLQQEAARKLGFTAKKTMQIAQQLYEGIDIGNETVGLITYMRTDSTHLATEAISDIRNHITETYGNEYVPEKPCFYKTSSKNAQEAHEAIRPTSIQRTPENIKNHLSLEQLKLYTLVWRRTLACQMLHATINTVSIDLKCGANNTFHATGSTILHPGFIAVYQEGKDDQKDTDDAEKLLPSLQEGDIVKLLEIIPNQHFTEPPPRYTEASLIKTLEEYGIGRPSTYATIISTIQNREYVILENKQFKPTDIGKIVNKFLTEYFPKYVDYKFTANLEDELDDIANGKTQWIPLLENFWQPFNQLINSIEATVQRKDVTQEELNEVCPLCGKPLLSRLGKRGSFIGCSGYPTCTYTRNTKDSASAETPPETTDKICPKCNSPLVIKTGRFGKFLGCSKYPECKHIEPLNKPTDTEVLCPECKKANLLQRRSRRGKIFYSCANYPKCKYALWNEPINEQCPKCNWPILTIKVTKTNGREKVCPQKDCGYTEKTE